MPRQGHKGYESVFQRAPLIVTGQGSKSLYAIGITHARRPHDPRIYAALDWYGLFGRSRCAGPGCCLSNRGADHPDSRKLREPDRPAQGARIEFGSCSACGDEGMVEAKGGDFADGSVVAGAD